MTGAVVPLGLAVLLAVSALAGPRILTSLAPAMAHRPRAGIAVWTSAVVLWTLGLLALGPLLAWLATGPTLPGAAGAVCRRCLEAANPFGMPALSAAIPPAAPLLGAAVLALGLLAVLTVAALRDRREARSHLAQLRTTAARGDVGGEQVWLVPLAAPAAYTLPRAGIVLSRGTVDTLDEAELGAVLAHERAHLRGRHHLLLRLLRGLRSLLGVVPLVRAAPAAVAAYAEMAADDAALRSHGRRALAGALLALHHPTPSTGLAVPGTRTVSALHAAADHVPSRVGRLAAAATRPSPFAGAMLAGYLMTVTAAVLLAVGPYLTVLVQGAC